MHIQTEYTCQDGAVANRNLLKVHFVGDPASDNFTCINICDPGRKLTFLMDPKVCFLHTLITNIKACKKIYGLIWTFIIRGIMSCTIRNISYKMFLMFQHNHKKVRNNLLTSGTQKHHKRLLKVPVQGTLCEVRWSMWVDAWRWDQGSNSLPIHPALTHEHMYPNNSQKMRNRLAEDCLGDKMLLLMKVIWIFSSGLNI